MVGGVLGFTFQSSPTLMSEARGQSDEIAASQAQHAAADRAIEPKPFVVPDLHSPQVRAAAKAHGINLHRWIANHT